MGDGTELGARGAQRDGATPAGPPPLGPVLRYYGPYAVVVVLGVGLLVGYARLAARLEALEARLDAFASPSPASDVPTAPAPGVEASAAATAAPLAGVRGEAPAWPCGVRLDEGAVRAVVGREGRAVFACVEARRGERPELAGTLDVRMRVGGTGEVEAVHVGGVEDDALVGCVARAVMGWTFPSPGAGQCAVVSAPFSVGDGTP